MTAVPPNEPVSVFNQPLTTLTFADPLQWLKLGWQDFRRCPAIGLFYGACFMLMGNVLWLTFWAAPAYVLALSAGFLLMGPFLFLGIYAASRTLADGDTPRLTNTMLAWRPTLPTMSIFAAVLLVLELLWGRASLVVFAVTMRVMPSSEALLAELLSFDNLGFIVTYVVVGAFFATLIFICCVISIPMILDREVDAITAALTSFRACLLNPAVMLFWGGLITVLTVIAMLPAFAGLLVVGPVLGHASWHAYKQTVSPA